MLVELLKSNIFFAFNKLSYGKRGNASKTRTTLYSPLGSIVPKTMAKKSID